MKTKAHISTPLKVASKMFPKTIAEYPKVEQRQLKKIKSSARSILVFLLDDDNLFLKALEHVISEEHPHLKIKIFQTDEACLEKMKLKPDVVVLDYYLNSANMNALDGLSVLKKIKIMSPKTKVIMLSAQDSLDIAMKCIDNEAYDYISKSESAFIKLNNVLDNIIEEIKLNDSIFKPYQLLILIFIIILLLKSIL